MYGVHTALNNADTQLYETKKSFVLVNNKSLKTDLTLAESSNNKYYLQIKRTARISLNMSYFSFN